MNSATAHARVEARCAFTLALSRGASRRRSDQSAAAVAKFGNRSSRLPSTPLVQAVCRKDQCQDVLEQLARPLNKGIFLLLFSSVVQIKMLNMSLKA
eukprot:1970837-Pleurochrysis_carterae.AAC.1